MVDVQVRGKEATVVAAFAFASFARRDKASPKCGRRWNRQEIDKN